MDQLDKLRAAGSENPEFAKACANVFRVALNNGDAAEAEAVEKEGEQDKTIVSAAKAVAGNAAALTIFFQLLAVAGGRGRNVHRRPNMVLIIIPPPIPKII